MRTFIYIFSFLFLFQNLHAQNMNQTYYSKKWKTVEEFFKKGLNKSAQTEIESILKTAKTENNTEQTIKALCNLRVSMKDRDEKSGVNNIKFFESELKEAKFPTKQILQSMLGDLYWKYYEDNRWVIMDRTVIEFVVDKELNPNLAEEKNIQNDIETWTADDFYKKAYEYFNASLSESEKSKTFLLNTLTEILENGINTEKLRPTLYDFLVNRAINHFSNDENDLTKPAYAFEINDEKAFANAHTFMNAKFNTSDTTSQKFQVIKLYQELLSFHSKDKDPSAFIDADIARLVYVLKNSTASNKNKLYFDAMKEIANKYESNEQAAMATFYMASFYMNNNMAVYIDDENEIADDKESNFKKAHQICKSIVEKFENSEASTKAKNLIQQIETHSLACENEKAILPNQASLALVTYKNIDKIYCKVVEISKDEYKDYIKNYNISNLHFKNLLENKNMLEWAVELPSTDDFKQHTTEIKIDALPIGTYALMISETKSFEKNSIVNMSFMHVSNLSYIILDKGSYSKKGIYVMHRESGQALENVKIKTWRTEYDYKERKYKTIEGASYTTDKNGYVALQNNEQNSWKIELIQNNDQLFLDDNIYSYKQNEQSDKEVNTTFLFTDRSIYRPGQIIYFKGIVIKNKTNQKNKYEVVANYKTSISLKDVNYQIVHTIEVTTNEYGSYQGQFTAPEGLLTGMFQLVAENGQKYVQIEEYKRPKFEVKYDTITGTYKLNDEVKIKGLAKAFAGNNIDGASVKYRVLRKARFPYYWCFYRWGQPSSSTMEITHGTITTQADGSFDILFKAIPDASIGKETMPVFDYEIIADVTDVNGETRSGSTHVSVSYQSMTIQLSVEEQININDFNALKVFTNNLSGTHVSTQVTLTLKKLLTPSNIYRSRLWKKPEINIINEKDFRKFFPLDEYNEENNYLNWKEEKTVWTKTFTTTKEGLEYLQKTGSGEGWYLLEAKAITKEGTEIIDKKYVRLINEKTVEALPTESILLTNIKTVAEPNETAKFGISTPYEKVYVLYFDNFKKQNENWITISKNKLFEYNIQEENRGGFSVYAMYIKNNRMYQTSQFINVPWTNKQLNISLETFRDKMLPGSDQSWELKITGSKKEMVSAEILATMYDASLDAFKSHSWSDFGIYRNNYLYISFNAYNNFVRENATQISSPIYKRIPTYEKRYRSLKWYGLNDSYYDRNYRLRHAPVYKSVMSLEASPDMPSPVGYSELKREEASGGVASDELSLASPPPPPAPPMEQTASPQISTPSSDISIRSNFAETAFFFPQLHTDAKGNVILKFKAPDALTRWKMMAFAHTKNIESATFQSTSVTQKELMIVPNTPRFFREGDKMVYSAKVTNLSEKDLSGNTTLEIINSNDEKNVDVNFKNTNTKKSIFIKKGESTSVTWDIEIPEGFTNPILIKTIAQANGFSDGEQNVIPILLNSMLVTETLPLPVKPNTTKTFKFENLLNSKNSNTLRHYNLSVEYTANPAWYAIQSLPYLTDFPYECAEQTFNRYYANAIASHIANSNPKIKEIFSTWQEKDTAALMSNLSKNQELKSALLQETPWVLEAKSEEEQKRNIAILFNMNRMSKELEKAVREIEIMQTINGGFTWFKGMPDDRFMTQYILTGIGKLMHIGISEVGSERRIQNIITKAIPYLDARIKEDYDNLIKYKADLSKQQIGSFQIQYLYMRSFFKEKAVEKNCKTAFDFYLKQAGKYWLNNGKYLQAMSSLALHRWNDETNAQAIIQSLRENAIHNEEMGMYYKDLINSYWWYEAPIEAQSMIIEAFKEVAMDEDAVDELKIWLLKNKQTTNWKTTKATADACYALLLNGTYWLAAQPEVSIKLNNTEINSKSQKSEAGTGYFKASIAQDEITADMGNISVSVKSDKSVGTTWGAVYWQYFENLDKIKESETGLKLKKQLYKISNTDRGEVLTPITENNPLNIGDKVKVRIELRVDRPMEYVHMKDMRAACFEPINVLSNYKYQGGLGYYEATKDMATNFFFHGLQKGTYVFEYPMFVTNKGDFSNGIATIQCMYAPEFSSHSEGVRVKVK